MRFAPRAVPARHALLWAREALALSVRAPAAHLALGLVQAALLALPGRLGDLAFASVPLLLVLGAAVARAVDEGRPSWRARVPLPACARLLAAGLALMAVAFAIVAALAAIAPAAGPDVGSGWPVPIAAPNALNDALGAAARATWFWALVLGPTLWFAPPLVALPGLGLGAAAVQAFRAFALNPFLVLVWGAAGVCLMLPTFVPALVVPGAALLSATLYTGYRDVWLGRTDNARREPARAALPARPTPASRRRPAPARRTAAPCASRC